VAAAVNVVIEVIEEGSKGMEEEEGEEEGGRVIIGTGYGTGDKRESFSLGVGLGAESLTQG
jgi:hypothetical protein